MKKSKQIAIRLTDDEWSRLVAVQKNIAGESRGQEPEIVEIIRSVMGWGNSKLVSREERLFLSGKLIRLGSEGVSGALSPDVDAAVGDNLTVDRGRKSKTLSK